METHVHSESDSQVTQQPLGILTAYTLSVWPDLIVGLAIAAMNAGAAREVWSAARAEHLAARA